MFGYATDETEECMPLTVVLSHKLNARLAALRRSGEISWARPDSKTQVSYYLKFKLKPLRSNRVQRLLEICMYFSTPNATAILKDDDLSARLSRHRKASHKQQPFRECLGRDVG